MLFSVVVDTHGAAIWQQQLWPTAAIHVYSRVELFSFLQSPQLPLTQCACTCPLQLKNGSELAQSTTEEEFKDNLYHICKAWYSKTQDPIIFSYDNNKIQAGANISTLHHPDREQAPISIDVTTQKLELPTYSPDLNRPIEHVFGCVKTKIRQALYKHAPKYNKGATLQTLVWDEVHAWFKKYPNSVKEDVGGLPMLWRVLSTPACVTFVDDAGHLHVGSGGDWPMSIYR